MNKTFNFKTSGYASHQPILKEVLQYVNGNILECGCGEGSTNFIKECMETQGKSYRLYSLESNPEYYDRYKPQESETHKVLKVDAGLDDTHENGKLWEAYCMKNFASIEFDLVFIDSCPWLSRKYVFDYYKNKAKIIIIHDVDYFALHGVFGRLNNTVMLPGGKIYYDCDFSNVVKNSLYYAPPLQYWDGVTGPPTLVCSDILSTETFLSMKSTILQNVIKYYEQ